jgi:hypothetical protein
MAKKKPATTNLLSTGDIAKLFGIESNSVSHIIARHKDFPAPAKGVTAGRLYPRAAVIKWGKANGRM